MDRSLIVDAFISMQQRLVSGLQEIDPIAVVKRDTWSRPDPKPSAGGGGTSIVIQDGTVFEKAGVNFSDVHGHLTREMSRALLGQDSEQEFTATGTSIVIHPRNPMVPTVHANVRFFQAGTTSWFGGGTDLTPYYLFDEDAQGFHRGLRAICDRHDLSYFPKFKKWCDDYFYLPHRGETRGVGGIFFDYLGKDGAPASDHYLQFVVGVAAGFQEIYLPIVRARKDLPYGERERHFQLIRRGRYVEFNLLYDRGTAFGLKSGGRTESILMSLPTEARWEYCYEPEAGSREASLLEILKSPRDWIT